jgi:glutamate formiminotransferase/formiminotetrahydrofolate cyclodeaminase
MLINMKLKEFLDELASSSPALGGGSVSALLGALSSALTSMVCRLTEGKKGYENVMDDIKKILEEAEEIRKVTTELIDEDTEVFNEVMRAYKTPKENPERGKIIQDAMKKATEVPLKTMRECYKALELARVVAEKGNVNSISDAGVAALTANTGLQSASLNVMINLKFIKDDDFTKKTIEEVTDLTRKSSELNNEIMRIVTQKI